MNKINTQKVIYYCVSIIKEKYYELLKILKKCSKGQEDREWLLLLYKKLGDSTELIPISNNLNFSWLKQQLFRGNIGFGN
jgi:hypothetical protein